MISSLPEIEKRIGSKDNKSDGVKSYDEDNCYPQNMIDIVNASGTATACVNLYAKFIQGGGFVDETFYKAKINSKGLTTDKLLAKISKRFALLNGYAIHVNYNALLQIVEVSHIPFEYCRLGIGKHEGKIAVYDDWACEKSSSIDKNKIQFIDVFNPDEFVLRAQIGEDISEYKGQILWRSALGDDYPLAPYDSVVEDIISDSDMKRFRLRSIRKGFNASTVIEYGYEFEGDEERKNEVENWGKFIGPESSDVIVIENANGNGDDKGIKLSKLDVTNNDKMYETTNNTVINSIVRIFNQPKRLVGLSEDKGFNSVDVEADYKYYNSVTYKERLMIEEDFKMIFEKFYYDINPSKNYSIIPLQYESGKSKLVSNFGDTIGDKVMSVLGSSLLPAQKVNMLVMIYNFSQEDAQKIVLGL